MVSQERLVLLYQETDDKRSREKIFLKIYDSLKKEAFDICHYYRRILNGVYDKDLFFEDAIQESKLCLLKCMDKFDVKKDTKLSTFYRVCLQNHLFDFYKTYYKIGKSEVVDSSVLDYTNGVFNDEENIIKIDNGELKKILDKHINDLPYSKSIHKQIFKDYIGFSDKLYKKESFGNIGMEYKMSRMAIKKITDKYFKLLIKSLKSNGDIEKIRKYL